MDQRLQQLTEWTGRTLCELGLTANSPSTLSPVSGDASFRRYFRATVDDHSWIAMDAPPERERCEPFVALATTWRPLGIRVPVVHAADFAKGFLLLEDLGDLLYLHALNQGDADALYKTAITTLLKIQCSDTPDDYQLPTYTVALLQNEMDLFPDWLCRDLLDLSLNSDMFAAISRILIDNALSQPQVVVHRDYHARNLMATGDGVPGVLDFQDAVRGPLTYDIVSLLRDCYLQWPEPQVRDWALHYATLAQAAGLHTLSDSAFLLHFNRMGVQRHLKASGIFARLFLRDGKPGYLADIPRTLSHIVIATTDDAALHPLRDWILGPMRDAMLRHERLATVTRDYLP